MTAFVVFIIKTKVVHFGPWSFWSLKNRDEIQQKLNVALKIAKERTKMCNYFNLWPRYQGFKTWQTLNDQEYESKYFIKRLFYHFLRSKSMFDTKTKYQNNIKSAKTKPLTGLNYMINYHVNVKHICLQM